MLYVKMCSIFLGHQFGHDRRHQVSKITRGLLWAVALTLALSACGIKGPLYIPEKKYPQNVSAPKTETYAQLHQITVNS